MYTQRAARPHRDLQLIEDLVPIHNVPVQLRVNEKIKKVTLIPDSTPLDFAIAGDYVKVMLPEFTMHCGIVFEN